MPWYKRWLPQQLNNITEWSNWEFLWNWQPVEWWDSLPTWNYYATNWSEEPTINSNNWDWDIYNYVLNWITRYRFVANDYSSTTDWFYQEDTLTTLIVMRG